MEAALLWFALGVGLVGAVWSALTAWGLRGAAAVPWRSAMPFAVSAVALSALVAAGAAPGKPPWAPGMALGLGFALGIWGGLKTAWLAACAGEDDEPRGVTAASLGPQFEAVAICAVCALWLRPVLPVALAGVGLGWATAVALMAAGAASADDSSGVRAAAVRAALGLLFAVTVCAALTVAFLRDALSPATARGPWLAAAALAAAAVPTLGFLTRFATRRVGRLPGTGAVGSWLARALPGSEEQAGAAAAVQSLLIGALFVLALWAAGTRVPDGGLLPVVALVGVLVGLLVSRLAAEEQAAGAPATAALALLVPVAGFMVAGQLLQGLGVGVMALGALATATPSAVRGRAARGVGSEPLLAAAAALAALALVRAFTARYAIELRGAWAADSYVVLGFALGALAPALFGGALALERELAQRAGRVLVRFATVGVVALAVSVSVPYLWGGKCLPALLAGLVVGLRGPGGREGLLRVAAGLGIALLAYQAFSAVLQADAPTRADKVLWLWYCAGAVAAAWVVDLVAHRVTARSSHGMAEEQRHG